MPAASAIAPTDTARDAFRALVARKVRHAVHARSTVLAERYAAEIDQAVHAYIDEQLRGA